jgi:hypothetical protein
VVLDDDDSGDKENTEAQAEGWDMTWVESR